jgi:hypothetical protein
MNNADLLSWPAMKCASPLWLVYIRASSIADPPYVAFTSRYSACGQYSRISDMTDFRKWWARSEEQEERTMFH